MYPISWFVPLFEVGLINEIKLNWEIFNKKLPVLFEMNEVSIFTSVQVIWQNDPYLALLVTFFALVAPLIKVMGMLLIQLNLMSTTLKPVVAYVGKLAMADVFLIAFACVIIKGVNLGEMNVLWGTYMFSGCVLLSIIGSLKPK